MIRSGFTSSTSSAISPNSGIPWAIDLLLVAKAHRLKRQDDFAGFAHWLDILLESRRGRAGSELTVGIYKDGSATEAVAPLIPVDECGGDIRIADPDGVALARHAANDVADIDIVSACGQIGAGAIAQGGVVATGVVEERYVTTGCVAVAGV